MTKEATGGRGVDVILDMVGGDYIQRNINALAVEGRIVYIAFLKGPQAEINLMPLMLKRGTLTGSTLRARRDMTLSWLRSRKKRFRKSSRMAQWCTGFRWESCRSLLKLFSGPGCTDGREAARATSRRALVAIVCDTDV